MPTLNPPSTGPVGGAPPWTRTSAELWADLASSAQGLSALEAARRLRADGPNSVQPAARAVALKLLAHQFASPLVLILLLGAAVSLFLRDWADAGIILAIVLGSTLLGFSQEARASAAVAALRQRLALTTRVRRHGTVHTLPATQLVRGDVVELAAGNLVPADGVLVEAKDLMLSEAPLTGESFPVEKQVGTAAANAPPGARSNSVFDLLTFVVLLFGFAAGMALFQTAWFVVSVLTELVVVLVLRTRRAAWRSRPSALLLWATVAVIVAAVALPYSGPLAAALGFVPLPPALLFASLAIVGAYVVLTEFVKHRFYRRQRLRRSAPSRARRR